MDAVILRRKVGSALKRLQLVGKAVAAGGRLALTGVKESLTLRPTAAPEGPPPPPGPYSLQTETLAAFDLAVADLQARPPPRQHVSKQKAKRVVMFTVSALRIDPRIEREARALAARGFEVVVIGPDVSEPPLRQKPIDWGPGISFETLSPLVIGFIVQAPWFYCAAMTKAGVAHDAFAYHGHDLWTTLIALECAARTGGLAITDFHEWASENVSWDHEKQGWAAHPAEQAAAFREMENLSIRLAALTITVNRTLADGLEDAAGAPRNSVAVVRNIPKLDAVPTRSYPPLKQQLELPEETVVVIYQGGTGPSRLLEPVIQSLAHLPAHVVLVIRGPSLEHFGEGYREVARRAGVANRLILKEAVPSRDVVEAARGADIGLWTLPDLSKNFRFALPNKVFEYMASGLPLAAANFPEVASIVRTHTCGETFDPYNPVDIAAALSRMLDPEVRRLYSTNAALALKALDADREWERFADLYEALWAKSNA